MRSPARRLVSPALLAGVLLAHCAGPAREIAPVPPPAAERRVFPVLDQGGLEVGVPAGWKAKTVEGLPGTPAAIRLDAPGGGALFLSPFLDDEVPARDAARLFVELARRKAMDSGAEREPTLETLEGADGALLGWWFVATDRDYAPPPPGKERWRHMLRGAVGVGQLLLSFTWFDDAPGPDRDAVLGLVREARHVAGAEAERPASPDPLRFTPDPDASTVPLAVDSPGETFTVLVDLPGFRMYVPRPSPDGQGVLVLGQHPVTGLVASVTLRAAGSAADAQACRDRKVAAMRKAAPDLAELRTSEQGGAARASYVLRELRGKEIRQDHAHAFLWRDATCVDVQVSKADPEHADAGRIEAILGSVRFAERL